MHPLTDLWQNYGLLAVSALVFLLLATAVVLATVAHAVAEWDPAEAGRLSRAAAILSAVAHGIEGLVFKWPFTSPPMDAPLQRSAVEVAKADAKSGGGAP